MSGVHHSYNRLGRQKYGPQYNPFTRGPRDPHRHKVSHGYWEQNPDTTENSDRYRWVHDKEHVAPHVPTPVEDSPFAQLLLNAFTPMGYAPTNKSNASSMNPMVLAGIAVAAYLFLKK